MSSDAVAGLLGVLAGGLITFGIEWWRERRHRQGEARVAMFFVQAELSLQLAWLRKDPAERRALQSSNPAWEAAQRCEAWRTYAPAILGELSAFDTAPLMEHYLRVQDTNEASLDGRIALNERVLLTVTRWIANRSGGPAPQKPHMFERAEATDRP
jgi:hypothetical protein